MNYLSEQKFFSHLAAGEKQRQEGKFHAAELLFGQALTVAQSDRDTSVSDRALVLQHLATLYYESGRTSDAEETYRRICTMWERERGAYHPAVALCLEVLAEINRAQGKTAEAQTIRARAKSIWDRLMSKDSAGQAQAVA